MKTEKHVISYLASRATIVVLTLTLFACYTPPFKPLGSPSGHLLNSKDRGADVISQIANTAASIKNFKLLFQTTLTRSERVEQFRQSVIFERPRSFRIETLAPNAFFALNTLLVKSDQAVFLDATQKQARVFESADVALRQRFRLPISAENLATFLTGRLDSATLEQLAQGSAWEVYLDYENAEYQLRNYTRNAQFILSMDTFLLKRFELRDSANGKLQLQGFYDFGLNAQPLSFPKSLQLILRDFSLTLAYRMAAANTELAQDLFNTVIPSGYSQLLDDSD